MDTDGGKFYWTQKGGHDAGVGRICRANIQVPQGQSAGNRGDIELLYDSLPEPIDLDLDHRGLYWTDRGDPPRGNTLNRAPMDPEAEGRKEPEILFTHLMEGIGLGLDLKGGRMFMTDFGGSVYSANLDGSTEGRCWMLKETSPALHSRSCRPDIERQRREGGSLCSLGAARTALNTNTAATANA